MSAAAVLTGAVGVFVAAPALAATPAEVAARTAASVAGTPCTAAASACVDVNNKKAWLIKDGRILRGPVPIATGGPGEDTPTGEVFRVYRKDKTHTTDEFKLPNGKPAPMPDSVFFEDGGIAFHAGDPKRASAGCVHLNLADAEAFYNYLQIGNHVHGHAVRAPTCRRACWSRCSAVRKTRHRRASSRRRSARRWVALDCRAHNSKHACDLAMFEGGPSSQTMLGARRSGAHPQRRSPDGVVPEPAT